MSNKPKFTTITTPAGTAIYPKLTTPDTKYKALGEYTTKVLLTAEEAQPIIDKYEAELATFFEAEKAELMKGDGKAKAKAKGLKLATDRPFKPEYDDDGNETGNYIFNFKMPARIPREGKPDLVLQPDVFDAKGKKLTKVPEIWSGSKIRVSAQFRPFNTAIGVGISLRLQAVQILELRQGGSRDASGYGFDAEEGYSAEDGDDEATPFSQGATDSDAPEDDNKDF